MPKVSVIIPVYGVEKYIEKCARSLFEQTLDDIEYLFVDDCTPDKSVDILKQILEEYPHRKSQVVIHRMEQNSGQAVVREWGVKNAKGDFITHCDSDDWVDTSMYLEMYETAVRENADVVICDFVVTDSDTTNIRITACHAKTPEQFMENCLFQRDSWSLWNKFFRREIYYNIEYPQFSMGEDLATTTQLFLKVKKMYYIPKTFYYYYQNNNSTIHQTSEEVIVRKFHQLQDNTNIVINHLEKSSRFAQIIANVKQLLLMNACVPLFALFDKEEYRNMWRNACPELSLWYLIKTPFPLYSKYSYIKHVIKYRLKR